MEKQEEILQNNTLDNIQKGSILGGCVPMDDEIFNIEKEIINKKSLIEWIKKISTIH